MSEGEVNTAAREDLERWRTEAAANNYGGDTFVRRLIHRHVGSRWAEVDTLMRAVSELAGPALDSNVRLAARDENLPYLRAYDEFGRHTEEIVFHPAHHEAGRSFWGSGVLSALAVPGNEVAAGGVAYLLDQHGEAGHACPVSCTAGAIKLLQQVGTDDQKDRYLAGLLSSDYDKRLHASQFVTELQGGSDVGANASRATIPVE